MKPPGWRGGTLYSTEADRADWLARTGSAVPADAGAAYKRNGDVDRQPRIVSEGLFSKGDDALGNRSRHRRIASETKPAGPIEQVLDR